MGEWRGERWRVLVLAVLGLVAALLVPAISSGSAVAAAPQQGELDPSFGPGGILRVPVGSYAADTGGVVAVVPDGLPDAGKVVVVHPDGDGIVVERLLASGRPDPAFGHFGVTTLKGGRDDPYRGGSAVAVRIDKVGRILVAVQSFRVAALLRLSTRGERDPTFGDNGYAAGFGGNAIVDVLLEDGLAPVVSSADYYPGYASHYVARYTESGQFDDSFGAHGAVGTGSARGGAIAISGDGPGRRVVVTVSDGASAGLVAFDERGALDGTFGGSALVSGTLDALVADPATGRYYAVGPGAASPILYRFTTEGLPDTMFGPDGGVPVEGRFGRFSRLSIQADTLVLYGGGPGGLLMKVDRAGQPVPGYEPRTFAAPQSVDSVAPSGADLIVSGWRLGPTRLLADGTTDTSFGTGGSATPPRVRENRAQAVARSGEFTLIAGWSWWDDGQAATVLRLGPDGAPDPGFGVDGVATTTAMPDVLALGATPDGGVIAVSRFAAVKFAGSGAPDGRYGTGGTAVTPVFADGAAVDNSGRVVVAGLADDGFAVARLSATGQLDSGFGDGGAVDFSPNPPRLVTVRPDGDILVEHAVNDPLGIDQTVVQLRDDGSPDSSFVAPVVDWIGSMVVLPDGHLAVICDRGLISLRPDGTLDPGFGQGGSLAVDAVAMVARPDGGVVVAGSEPPATGAAIVVSAFDARGRPDETFGDHDTTRVDGLAPVTNAFAMGTDGDQRLIITSGVEEFAVARLVGPVLAPVAGLSFDRDWVTAPATVDLKPTGRARGDSLSRWTLDFGDGSGAAGDAAPPVTVAHTYERGGSYDATLTLTGTGGFTASAAARLHLLIAPPDIEPGVPVTPTTPATPAGTTRYFAEGTTRPGFVEYLTLANPSPVAATADLAFQAVDETGRPLPIPDVHVAVAGSSRVTVRINDLTPRPADVAIKLTSAASLAAERVIYFAADPGLGAVADGGTASTGAGKLAQTLLFAEGTVRPGFVEYLTVQNPGDGPGHITVRPMASVDAPGLPRSTTRTVPIGPRARLTLRLSDFVAGPADAGVVLEADVPVTAERVIYFAADPGLGGSADGATLVPAARQPASTFAFAEGTVRPGFVEYLTLLNPTPQDGTVTLDFLPGGTTSVSVPAETRVTVRVDQFVTGVADVAITGRSYVPVVAERVMYFRADPGLGATVDGGHATLGRSIRAGSQWFAEGTTRDGFVEYLTLANPGDVAVTARLSSLVAGAAPAGVAPVPVPARSRVTVPMRAEVPAGLDLSVGVSANGPLVVERVIYFSADPGLRSIVDGATVSTGD